MDIQTLAEFVKTAPWAAAVVAIAWMMIRAWVKMNGSNGRVYGNGTETPVFRLSEDDRRILSNIKHHMESHIQSSDRLETRVNDLEHEMQEHRRHMETRDLPGTHD